MKCGEERPSCLRCTSTGRQCDFINASSSGSDSTTGEAETRPNSAQSKLNTSSSIGTITSNYAVISKGRTPSRSPGLPANDTPTLSIPVYTFRALPIPSSMSRAFEYFLRRTSVDMSGPSCVNTWGHYILSSSTESTAVQYSVAALSGIHESRSSARSSPKANSECWKHYYFAVKAANKLVATVSEGGKNASSAKEELLVICSAFIIIEVLLGNLESTLKHLEGCFSLLQTFFAEYHMKLKAAGSPDTSSNPLTHLDSHLTELIGFFVRLEIQILSILPPKRTVVHIPARSSLPSISQLSQPLPSVMSESLYRLIKQSLVWIREYGAAFKYANIVPAELYQGQAQLSSMLSDWKTSYLASQDLDPSAPTTAHLTTNPETANLLLCHALTTLKVTTALSPSEHIFSTPENLTAFETILHCADTIVTQRNLSTAQEGGNFAQLVSFFALEMSTVEALYFTAIKCRHSMHRHRAIDLLKRAGREGVWDGATMARVAAHVIALEEESSPLLSSKASSYDSGLGMGVSPSTSTYPSSLLSADDEVFLNVPVEFDKYFPSSELNLDAFLSPTPLSPSNRELVSEVLFAVDQESCSLWVKCAWFAEERGLWRSESCTLSLVE